MECPVCKRRDITDDSCPRCGANLSHLQNLQKAHYRLMERGKAFLRERQFQEGLKSFRQADKLMKTDQARKGLIVAAICRKSFQDYHAQIHI